MARKLVTGKSPSGHPLKGASPISQGKPAFMGGRTTAAGNKRSSVGQKTGANRGIAQRVGKK